MNPRFGQLFFIGIRGTTLTAQESTFIVEHGIGGVILFARNIESPRQVLELTAHLQSLAERMPGKAPLFIGVDQEGGRVARLKAPFTQWPPASAIGRLDSATLAYDYAFAMGAEMRAVGINVDFAPCADILTNPKNTVIGDRAFGIDPEKVAKLASAVVRGLTKAGVIACAKHFPGHGDTRIDSHDSLPVEDAALERLRSVELIPFKKLFRSRLDMLMTAHIRFAGIDPEPVTFSPRFLKDLLRGELDYRGLVISDDLGMGALAKNYATAEIPVRAFAAGCDMLLYCNEFDHPAIAIGALDRAIEKGELTEAQLEPSLDRVQRVKSKLLTAPPDSPLAELPATGWDDHELLSNSLKNRIANI